MIWRMTSSGIALPIRTEFLIFFTLMQEGYKNGIDPLTFYAVHGMQIPIFKHSSAQVLPVATVSGVVERLFGISGMICSPVRSCLSGDTVNMMLISLYYWLKEDYCYVSKKEAARKAKDMRLCKINFDISIQDAVEYEDDATSE